MSKCRQIFTLTQNMSWGFLLCPNLHKVPSVRPIS